MKLKELREERKLNQETISKIAHCSQSNYSKYELQKLEPGINTLINLANYYNVSLDYLCDRSFDNESNLIDEQIVNIHLIKKLSRENNLIATGYLTHLFDVQEKSRI